MAIKREGAEISDIQAGMDTHKRDSLSIRGQERSYKWGWATKGILIVETGIQKQETFGDLANNKTSVWLESRI